MQQNKIWMLFLIIGISLHGCTDHGGDNLFSTGVYNYTNTFGSTVKFQILNRLDKDIRYSKTMLPNDSIRFDIRGEGIGRPFNTNCFQGDSVVIQFSDNKCTSYWGNLGGLLEGIGVFDLKEYKQEFPNWWTPPEEGKVYYYRYTIDSTDYNLAKPCK